MSLASGQCLCSLLQRCDPSRCGQAVFVAATTHDHRGRLLGKDRWSHQHLRNGHSLCLGRSCSLWDGGRTGTSFTGSSSCSTRTAASSTSLRTSRRGAHQCSTTHRDTTPRRTKLHRFALCCSGFVGVRRREVICIVSNNNKNNNNNNNNKNHSLRCTVQLTRCLWPLRPGPHADAIVGTVFGRPAASAVSSRNTAQSAGRFGRTAGGF